MNKKKFSESKLENLLYQFLDWYKYKKRVNMNVRTFEAAMVLSDDKGLVVRVGDDTYQITIVKVS